MKTDKLFAHMATLGPIGFMPMAPGTWGTAVAALLVWFVHMPTPIYLAITLAVIVLGTISSDRAEEVLGKKDPGCVIIDEVAGYMVSMAFLPVTAMNVALAFLLFRFFDIVKPPPINRLQNLGGGIGVMADDIAAGLLTNAILQAWRLIG